jgi:transcriptional regulator with XRE-family HTH domain
MSQTSLGYFSLKELGQAIRAERKAIGRTQQWVADQCRLRSAAVSDIENGKNVELFTVILPMAGRYGRSRHRLSCAGYGGLP